MMWPQEPNCGWLERHAADWPDLSAGLTLADVAGRAGSGISYLATPYSRIAVDHDGTWNSALSEQASDMACWVAAGLARRGVTAISPVVNAHAMLLATFVARDRFPDPLDHAFWMRWCRPLLFASDRVLVPPIAGWRASVGVWHEVGLALRNGIPVWLIGAGDTDSTKGEGNG